MKLVKIAVGVLALGALALTPLNSEAQISMKPKVLLHIKAVTTKTPCAVPTTLAGLCANADMTGDLNQTYHMQVIVDLGDSVAGVIENDPQNGLAGVQFGIRYPGSFDPVGNGSMINVFGWTLCGTLEFAMPNPVWPSPEGGNLITWDAVNLCQRNRLSCAGFFYMTAYSAGTFMLIPRPADNVAKFADCASVETLLTPGELGAAQFSAGGGADMLACNPCLMICGGVPVRPTTWSSIKTLNGK